MAIVSMQLDPNAVTYTDDQIVGKINNASTNITRASSVAAAARPIADSEVTDAKIAAGAIKTKLGAETDGNKLVSASLAAAAGIVNAQVAEGLAKTNLDALADTARGYIKTGPTAGEFKVVSIQRDATGKLDVDYDNVAV